MELRRPLFHLAWDLLLFELSRPIGLVHVRLHAEEIHHTAEAARGSNGHLHGDGGGVQALSEIFNCPKKVCALPIHSVRKEDHGETVLLGIAPHLFRLNLNPIHRAHQE